MKDICICAQVASVFQSSCGAIQICLPRLNFTSPGLLLGRIIALFFVSEKKIIFLENRRIYRNALNLLVAGWSLNH